ncbi:MAG: PhzF family phenazine biosynthesis protein [Bryobacteraceae bacterium]|jgi:PhzF family phenazine biosynthesis protein
MNVPIYQVDAFTGKLFGGNPAAICPLDVWLPDATMQSIAAENNLADTAFYVRKNGGFHIRWFTPGAEVDLCGHATLAAAHVVMELRKEAKAGRVAFDSKSGELVVTRESDLYALDFPTRPPSETKFDDKLFDALGAKPKQVLGARDYLCVFETEAEVRAVRPNMEKLAAIDRFGTIITAPGADCDFVSRFFAPAKGVPEDSVTGSAHCTLIPYWSERLGKTKLFARQISQRGGELWCEHRGDRVSIAGRAVKYLEGTIVVS